MTNYKVQKFVTSKLFFETKIIYFKVQLKLRKGSLFHRQ